MERKWRFGGRKDRKSGEKEWGGDMSLCLTGEYEHKLDAKGRFVMPLKIREEIGNSFMITNGFDQCLYVYPHDEWKKFAEKLNLLAMTDKNARAMKRFFNSGANNCEIDGQGRLLIPQKLRNYANIEKEIVVIGNGEKAEIWDKAAWEKINNEESLNIDEIADQLNALNFIF